MTTATMKMKQDTVRAIYYVWLYLYGRGKMFHTKNMDRKFKHILADQIKFGSTNGRNGTKNKHNSFRVAEAHCMVRDLPLCHYIQTKHSHRPHSRLCNCTANASTNFPAIIDDRSTEIVLVSHCAFVENITQFRFEQSFAHLHTFTVQFAFPSHFIFCNIIISYLTVIGYYSIVFCICVLCISIILVFFS